MFRIYEPARWRKDRQPPEKTLPVVTLLVCVEAGRSSSVIARLRRGNYHGVPYLLDGAKGRIRPFGT